MAYRYRGVGGPVHVRGPAEHTEQDMPAMAGPGGSAKRPRHGALTSCRPGEAAVSHTCPAAMTASKSQAPVRTHTADLFPVRPQGSCVPNMDSRDEQSYQEDKEEYYARCACGVCIALIL